MYSSVVVYLARIRVGCPGFLLLFFSLFFPFFVFFPFPVKSVETYFGRGIDLLSSVFDVVGKHVATVFPFADSSLQLYVYFKYFLSFH